MNTEIEREQFTTPKVGDKVRLSLVATKTERINRQRNGITLDDFHGTASVDLKEGERFYLDIGFGVFNTSVVKRIGKGVFDTENSTYSYEVMR